jgi:hypothetical protein
MEKNVQKLKDMNPDYEYFLFDDNDCRNYLETNYGKNYAIAFDTLNKGAFKCDFWRYAILYKEGGVYIDIDMDPLVPLDNILKENDKFVSVVDISHYGMNGIYQAFLACEPNHKIMFNSLEITFINIMTRRSDVFHNFESLTVTGPGVVNIAMNMYWNRRDTGMFIKPGKYDDGITLLTMDPMNVFDLDKRKIFSLRYDGFQQIQSYNSFDSPYIDDPRRIRRYYIIGIMIFLIIFCIILLFKTFKYKYELESCRSSSSSS